MSDTSKKILRILGFGVLWVFILSVRIGGKTIFHYANNVLVQNRIVAAIDQTLVDGYDAVIAKVASTYNSVTGLEKKL